MQKRRINKRHLYIILSVITISAFSLTIAYAVLSSTLMISGSAKVNASNWNIKISKSTFTNEVAGSATYTTPTITGTTIANYSVSLTKPGDSVTLYFNIQNEGTLNGEISSIINSTPSCISTTGNTSDASLVCDNLDISFSYFNNENISVGDVINTDSTTCRNGYSHDEASILKIIISLDDKMTSVPSSKVTISNLSHEIVYTQTDKICNSTSGEK